LTQIELSHRAGVSCWRLGMAEAGLIELRADEIQALRQALKPALEKAVRVVQEFQQADV